MTSYGSVKSAIESMKLGAADYITKPLDHEELLLVVRRLLDQRQLQRRDVRSLRARGQGSAGRFNRADPR